MDWKPDYHNTITAGQNMSTIFATPSHPTPQSIVSLDTDSGWLLRGRRESGGCDREESRCKEVASRDREIYFLHRSLQLTYEYLVYYRSNIINWIRILKVNYQVRN